MNERNYFALLLISLFFQIVGYLTSILGFITPLMAKLYIQPFPPGLDGALLPIAFFLITIGIIFIASGQKIKVIIDTEENTRTTSNHLVEVRALLSDIKDKIK